MKFWATVEFKAFIGTIDGKDHVDKVLFTTAYLTGILAREILALQWEDIDFGRNEIHISRTLSHMHSKILSPRQKALIVIAILLLMRN